MDVFSASPSTNLLRLGQILLARISHDDTTPITYELHTFDFANAPAFAALSYARGTDLAASSVPCRLMPSIETDAPVERSLRIPLNLEKALAQLTGLSSVEKTFLGHEYMWVDALCIDQTNNVEKAHQILNMHRVYGSASEILIYLGEAKEDSNEAMAVIATLATMIHEHGEGYLPYKAAELGWHLAENQLQALASLLKVERRIYHSDTIFRDAGLPDLSHPVWPSLASVYARSWFTRLWTLQEACLGSKARVICGDRLIDWLHLKDIGYKLTGSQLMYISWRDPQDIKGTHASFGAPIRFFRYDMDEKLYPTFLHCARERLCSHDHDHVYATLGIAPAEVRADVLVDYDAPLPEVFASLSRAVMKRFGWNAVVSETRSEERYPGLPSWCPDYRYRSQRLLIGRVQGANKHFEEDFSFDPNDHTKMTITGAQLDEVTDIVQDFNLRWRSSTDYIYGAQGDAARLLKHMDACEGLVRSKKPGSSEDNVKEQFTRAFLQNPCTPHSFLKHPESAMESLQRVRSRLIQLSQASCSEDVKSFSDEDAELTNDIWDFYTRLWLGGQVFFATKGGRFGMGHDSVRTRDTIVTIVGADHLYVLRPVRDELHEFVSLCYVTEISDGVGISEADLTATRKVFTLV